MHHNIEHGITPQSITKAVTDVMEGAYAARGGTPQDFAKVAEAAAAYARMTPELLAKKINQLEQQMYQHAQDLEFEEAAHIRDEIGRLREHGLAMLKASGE